MADIKRKNKFYLPEEFMQIPLIAKTFSGQKAQYLEIWRNSQKEKSISPFSPYFYSKSQLNIAYPNFYSIEKIDLNSMQKTNLFKYSFDSDRVLKANKSLDAIEADFNFLDKIQIDQPDFFNKFANTDPLKILHFDIETDTIGLFPTPERNAIIGIGCKCGDKKKMFIAEKYNDDTEILNKFINFIKDCDPDIISHYNGNFFDIPYITSRLKIDSLPQNIFSRDGSETIIYDNPHTGRRVSFGGRISFDIYNQVLEDQTLFGIKNMKMKTVAKWIDTEKMLDVIEIPLADMRSLVNTEKLRGYLQSDVTITEFLFNVYFKNVLMLAEMNKTPLNLIVHASPSFLPQLIHGRAFRKLNMIVGSNNGARHPQFIKNKQGALVNTFRPGIYRNGIHKVDFASQYPRVAQTFNVSPDTVRLIRYDPFTGEYWFERKGNILILSIPDDRSQVNAVIELDMSRRGFLAQFMDEVLTERFGIKKRMKTLNKNSTEYQYLYVRQNALKVIANIQTGYHGSEYAKFGDLTCYRVITGMGRYYAKAVIKHLGNPVAVDTDGIYHDQKPDIIAINKMLDDMTMKNFGLLNYLHMELESYDAAYFRKTKGKHYVLKEGDKIILHGQSFKGSHMPLFWDQTLEQACKDLFAGKDIRQAIDLRKFSLGEIMQSKKVKDKKEYKSDSTLSMQLIKQAEKEMGYRLNASDQINYVKTTKGYEIILPGKTYNIDYDYYNKIVEKIYERLTIDPEESQPKHTQRTLGEL